MATLETEIAPAAPGTAQEERNRAMALRWFAAMNRGELEVVYELFAESYVLHVANGPEGVFGPAVIRGVIEAYRAAFPDLAFTVQETVAEGSTVVVRWAVEGTNLGELMGMPATGRRARWTGTSWLRFAGGRIVEDWVESDLVYRDRTGETYALGFNPAQHWYWFPLLAPEEAILIKGYDSATDVARFTAHSAFEDPASRPGAPGRESIEVRALLLY